MATQHFSTSNHRLGLWLVCGLSLLGISCGHTQPIAPIPTATAMQAVQDYGLGHQSAPSSPRKATAVQVSTPPDGLYDSEPVYEGHLATFFAQNDFAALEKEAQEARTSKARLTGGVWKLLAFYEAVSKPGGNRASDSDWDGQVAAVRRWIAAYPNSATARIALAETYINCAWAARGNGYADSVSQRGWNSFEQGINLAESALLDAAKLNQKDPYWYEAMQAVALAQGWDKQQARTLLDQAAAFEPTYYHYYREHAHFLLPKWYGEEGETQAFAEEIYERLGDSEGSIVYFEIASLLACQCDSSRDSLAGMSWPTIKKGYAELQRLYGTSNLKMNRYAYMAFLAGDKASASPVLVEIAGSWDPQVWQTAANFQAAKTWSSTQ